MRKIKDYEGREWELSDEVYVITDNDHPSHDQGYGKGDKVRIINYPSPDEAYVVTCSLKAKIAGFCGIKKTSLRKI
jgi:hypothetical protein